MKKLMMLSVATGAMIALGAWTASAETNPALPFGTYLVQGTFKGDSPPRSLKTPT